VLYVQSSGIPAGGWQTSSYIGALQSALSSAQAWIRLQLPGSAAEYLTPASSQAMKAPARQLLSKIAARISGL
jgi:hypothetical protein